MSTWTLRPLAVPDDFVRLAEIFTACGPEPTTVESLQEQAAKSRYEHELQLVAVAETGFLAGYGYAHRRADDTAGRFQVKVWTDPACRGQGLGALLVAPLERFAIQNGAIRLDTGVRDDAPDALAFARKRGYEIDRRLFESALDPNSFDESRFAGVRTNNDSENGPMLAINRKLGYEPRAGLYRMKKDVRVEIRPLQMEADVAVVASLWQYVESDPPTPEELLRAWKRMPEGGLRHRLVATDAAGAVIGYAGAGNDPFDEPGYWFTRVVVNPEFRGRGVGRDLFERLAALVREDGGLVFRGEVREGDAAAAAWAERRGFKVDRHLFESVLDLSAFAETPYTGVIAGTGLRFFTRAEDSSEETARKVWALTSRTVLDIPGVRLGRPSTFEEWRQWALDEELFSRDCFIMAADGDRVVGVTLLEKRAGGAMYTAHTSVDREYRGRKVALALKLLSIQVAKRYGAPYMRTHNDSLNGPMLAVNRKLGYRPEPGVYVVEKR